ncbi:MMPL family transporter [Actinomadura sp. NEAU-AAG7]|uniref:MMPL family transporter n=1 Tax=Actinomadura sp. NEAU-AAG7 TaxID=2839640 RepID=UPI001BE427D6|nr:MMPL family transporter [Actinomadura sp. NEAU-AAG7]MBT2206746.1 MMPL family transporter [Actinomadura sp. NEAU-AAG7]
MLEGLGRLVHRRRWAFLLLVIVLTGAAGAFGPGLFGPGVFARFKSGGFEDPRASSALADRLGRAYFGGTDPDVLVLYRSDTMKADDPRFKRAITMTTARLPRDRVEQAVTYWAPEGVRAGSLVSRDRHATLVALELRGADEPAKLKNYEAVRDRLRAPGLTARFGGAVPLAKEFGEQAAADIVHAETITALPLLLLLTMLFGAFAAAVPPLLVAMFAILGGLAVLHAVTYAAEVTSFAPEVVTMMGAGLAIDYSLLVVGRFREELARRPGAPREDALGATMATAGRTVVASGVTVSAALGGLLLFPQMFLRTIGLAGIATVAVAVFGATVLLPTCLALLGPRVEWGRMPWRGPGRARRDPDGGFWYRLARSVMRRPLPYFAAVLVVLGVMAVPFLGVRFVGIDARVLPEGSGARTVAETVERDFPGGAAEPIDVVVSGDLVPRGWKPGRRTTVPPYLEDFRRRLGALPGVTDARFTGYSGEYGGARISITHRYDPLDARARDLVRTVRRMSLSRDGYPMHVDVGGGTATRMDLMAGLARTLPKMAIVVGLATFVLLFMFFRSIVLPLKAIAMNVLSIGASFGAIVWGFQEGHLAGVLDFTPTGGVEATSMILVLAVVFGLSMDYEVFLLSRIREEWDRTRDDRAAVASGMQRAGGVVTGAALLFLVVVGGFATAGLTVVKLIGAGMFVAVAVDAALVRSLLVPATMRFLGAANWWLPRPLAALHAHMDLRERDSTGPLDLHWEKPPGLE